MIGRRAAIALLILSAGTAAVARAGTIVTVSTGTTASGPGDLIHVTVKIQNARNVGSVPFTLGYDPSILELVPAASIEGGFLRRDRASTSFLVSPGPASRSGTVLVGLSRLGGGPAAKGAGGASGKGTLCRLTFRARAPGVSPLSFTKASVMDPSANPIEATFRGSSVRVKRRS